MIDKPLIKQNERKLKMKKLIMIMGVPGSGKTTKAKELQKLLSAYHFEADMFMTDESGNYKFDPDKLGHCHDCCWNKTFAAMYAGATVIVSNTFIKAWEREKYFELARRYGYEVLVIRMNTEYKSIHEVPEDKLEWMRNNIEPVTETEVKGLTVTFKSIGGNDV